MTESYVFKKSVTKRMLETATVLGARGTSASASEVKHKWGIYTQTFLDVTPYLGKAVWRIPRDLCEQMSIKYPTFVLGIMQEVNLEDLTALYIVTEVQDSGELLEKIQHPSLVDLWPIKYFSDDTNIRDEEFSSGLANCLDQMRFFYQHLWMPWDRDENCNDWVDKHLESRIKFYNDLETKAISKRLSSHIVTLLDEAKYLQSQRRRLERDLRQGAQVEEFTDSSCLPFLSTMSVLLEIHLRLYSIKNDMAFLENRLKRSSFEKKIFSEDIQGFAGHVIAEVKNLAVTPVGTVQEQIDYLERVQELVYEMPIRSYDSLQTALERCEINDKIYLPNGEHPIKFSGYLGYGSITAVNSMEFATTKFTSHAILTESAKEISVVSSRDDASVVLTIDGDYCIENIFLNCANAEVGVMIKRGIVKFKNCYFFGDRARGTKKGIVIIGKCNVQFECCIIQDFHTGIYCCPNSTITVLKTSVWKCCIGIDVVDSRIIFKQSDVSYSERFGIRLKFEVRYTESTKNEIIFCHQDYEDLEHPLMKFKGTCEFRNNKQNFALWSSADMDQHLADIITGSLFTPSNSSQEISQQNEEPARSRRDISQRNEGPARSSRDISQRNEESGRFLQELEQGDQVVPQHFELQVNEVVKFENWDLLFH